MSYKIFKLLYLITYIMLCNMSQIHRIQKELVCRIRWCSPWLGGVSCTGGSPETSWSWPAGCSGDTRSWTGPGSAGSRCDSLQKEVFQGPILSIPLQTEPVFVNLFKEPRNPFPAWRPVRQLYLMYQPARLHRLAESIPWNRFLGSLNVFTNSGSG